MATFLVLVEFCIPMYVMILFDVYNVYVMILFIQYNSRN